ncbi:zf-HC2 domain-containing protein [Nakamurella silvestris]|nr:zf-HC2 domain-containing protein [Nakamurella silvestris]
MNDICSSAGAFVIGALDRDEDRVFAAHLRTCPDCDREVGELAGLLAFTHAIDIDPSILAELSDPDPVTAPVPLRPRRDRRPLLIGLGAVLVAAAIATFAVLGAFSGRDATPGTAAVAMDRVFPNTGASTIRVQVTGTQNASSINVLCSIAASNDGYRTGRVSLWVHTRSGTELEVTSWPVHEGTMTFPGEVPVTPDQIDLFELRDQSGQVLNTMPA